MIATWNGPALLTGLASAGFVVGYAASALLPGKGRGILAFAIPILVTLGFAAIVSLQNPGEVAGIVEWVMVLSAIIGLELGVFVYSLRHRDRLTSICGDTNCRGVIRERSYRRFIRRTDARRAAIVLPVDR